MPSGLKEASEQLRSLRIFTAPAGPGCGSCTSRSPGGAGGCQRPSRAPLGAGSRGAAWLQTAPDGCQAGEGAASCEARGFLCRLCPAHLACGAGGRTRSCTHPARPLLIPARDSEGCSGKVRPGRQRYCHPQSGGLGARGPRCTPGCVSVSHPQLLSPKPPGSTGCYVSAFPLCKSQKPREMKR